MINRQKLIEELLDEHCGYGDSNCERCAFDCLIRNVVEALSQPPADVPDTNVGEWIPCSSGILPKHKQNVFITLELLKGRRYCTTVTYYTEMGIVDEYEWTGEGFYSYDSEYGYGKYEKVIAWMPAEPYMGVE